MWVGDTSLRHIFPRLFTLSEKKECCTYLKLYLSFCLFNFWQSITFDRYSIEEGIDHYGFNTSMVTTNSSLKLTFTNTATFSGIHVTSIPLEMKNYNQLPIATGNIPNFYQRRKSARSIDVKVEGSQIPVHIAPDDYVLGESIPLTLNMIVNSKANVLWILVTHKFNMNIECSLYMDTKKMGVPIPLTNTCKTFD
ncbi:putative Late embryogenesis abundant protein, LEA-14 [Medicago truncatula]|uniref:Putative Late embryogenesis abundant protein, LEA-14 n=1 Tax=Medicago truncatula TaxID=3880 RepID=A0A396IPL3_MEDTR|nr:putative Late embryogenesis abundant protein, LEA-14 [Medicago truncatula]